MTQKHRCRKCGGEMTSRRENYKYDASGLDDVVLEDIEVRQCGACGERAAMIPRVEALHRSIAFRLAQKAERLLPKEIRFMRKYLGLSSTDAAAKLGVDKATMSRYESIEDPQPMGRPTERLLRLMVLVERPVESYALENLALAEPKQEHLRFTVRSNGWQLSA